MGSQSPKSCNTSEAVATPIWTPLEAARHDQSAHHHSVRGNNEMAASPDVPRLHRHIAAMLALEQAIEHQLDSLSTRNDDDAVAAGPLETLLSNLRELTAVQRVALTARLRAIAPDIATPHLTAPISSFQRLVTDQHPASAALFAVHGAYSQAVIGYAVLMELANRAADNVERLGPDNTAELARQHMRAYVGAVRDIVRTIPRVVIDELESAGQECQCICPSCALGVCVCGLALRRQLAMAWADAGPIDAVAGIELVRPRQGSPAERGGLREGDLLLAVDGVEIESIPMLQEAIRGHPAGDEMVFRAKRGAEERRTFASCVARRSCLTGDTWNPD